MQNGWTMNVPRRVFVVSANEAPSGLVRVLLQDDSVELVDAQLTDDQLAARFGTHEVSRPPDRGDSLQGRVTLAAASAALEGSRFRR